MSSSNPDIGTLLQQVCPNAQPERPKAVITITSGYQIQVQTWDYNHTGHVRFISLAELKAAVADLPTDTGWLEAPGHWQILRCLSSGNRTWQVVWHPPGPHTINLLHPNTGAQMTITVPLPALVMVYSGRTGYLWASKLAQPHFKQPIELFLAPLPNVNGDGSLCLSHAAKTAFDWWTGTMTADWATGKVKGRGKGSKDIRHQLLALQGQSTYPLKDLVKAQIDLNRVLERLGGNHD